MSSKGAIRSILAPLASLTLVSCFMASATRGARSQTLSSSVVQIQNQAEPGTGFFLKAGKSTIFITAKHVLGGTGESVVLKLPNGSEINIPLGDQLPISNIDAAVLMVKNISPEISALVPDSEPAKIQDLLIVWGFPVSSSSTASALTSRKGQAISSPANVLDGYSLRYGASTQVGFSGGPILNVKGKVVGMHGRSESIMSPAGETIRTGNALGIPIEVILTAISGNDTKDLQIDEKALNKQASQASIKKIYQIMSDSSFSDQILSELSRAESGGAPKHCTEMIRAYYYMFFSSLPDMNKARMSLTIRRKTDGVDPTYYALASLVGRKSADFKLALEYNRILESTGNSGFLQYSERRLQDEILSAVGRCGTL